MARTSKYARLSITAKQAAYRAAMSEPTIPCPHCETQTTAADLIRHVETSCPGQREPHVLSKWVTWPEALKLGVTAWRLSRWARRGSVRSRTLLGADERARPGRPARRAYLLRDITRMIALRRKRN